MEILYTTDYISNLGKKCPLCAFNETGGQITVKSIQGLLDISCNIFAGFSGLSKICVKRHCRNDGLGLSKGHPFDYFLTTF